MSAHRYCKKGFMAWLWLKKIDPEKVASLRFDVPIYGYTEGQRQAWIKRIDDLGRQDDHWRDQRIRLTIWTLAGEVFREQRHQSRWVRKDVRGCLVLLRRAWAAHCVGRVDLTNHLLVEARSASLSAYHERMNEAFMSNLRLGEARDKGRAALVRKRDRKHARIITIARALIAAGSPRRGLAQRIAFEWKLHGWKRADGKAPSERRINECLAAKLDHTDGNAALNERPAEGNLTV